MGVDEEAGLGCGIGFRGGFQMGLWMVLVVLDGFYHLLEVGRPLESGCTCLSMVGCKRSNKEGNQ